MLKGKFTRKDNNKPLTTTRVLVGGELVQVGAAGIIIASSLINWCVFNPTKINNPPLFCSLQSYNYEGVDAKRIFKKQ